MVNNVAENLVPLEERQVSQFGAQRYGDVVLLTSATEREKREERGERARGRKEGGREGKRNKTSVTSGSMSRPNSATRLNWSDVWDFFFFFRLAAAVF